jgi:septation ring formation regulator EzrA
MANDPAPDFNNMQIALTILSTELLRIENIQPNQQHQQILHRFDGIEQTLQAQQQALQTQQETLEAIQQTLAIHSTHLISIKNTTIQAENKRNLLTDPTTRLLPLKNPTTRHIIPNCPTTVAKIHELATAQATNLLQVLSVPIPTRLQDKRVAVLREFVQ